MDTYLVEERGLFWWTDNKLEDNVAPDQSIYGTLTIDDDGVIQLALDNVMPSLENGFDAFLDDQPAITRSISGILKTSKRYVILSNLWRSGAIRSSSALSHDTYGAWTCLVSQYALNRTGVVPTFRNMTISLVGFEDWVGFGSIDIKPVGSSVKVGFKKHGNYTFRLADKTIRLRYGVDGPRHGHFGWS